MIIYTFNKVGEEWEESIKTINKRIIFHHMFTPWIHIELTDSLSINLILGIKINFKTYLHDLYNRMTIIIFMYQNI